VAIPGAHPKKVTVHKNTAFTDEEYSAPWMRSTTGRRLKLCSGDQNHELDGMAYGNESEIRFYPLTRARTSSYNDTGFYGRKELKVFTWRGRQAPCTRGALKPVPSPLLLAASPALAAGTKPVLAFLAYENGLEQQYAIQKAAGDPRIFTAVCTHNQQNPTMVDDVFDFRNSCDHERAGAGNFRLKTESPS